MHAATSIRRTVQLVTVTALLMIAAAGNALAQGVEASAPGLYAGVPGLGGRLLTPHSGGSEPLDHAARQLLMTTAENAPNLETAWKASARAAIELDPHGGSEPRPPRHAVVLTETHAEGRVHTVHVHPEALDTSLPVHQGPMHLQAW